MDQSGDAIFSRLLASMELPGRASIPIARQQCDAVQLRRPANLVLGNTVQLLAHAVKTELPATVALVGRDLA